MAEVEQPADRDIPPWVAVGLLAILLAGGGAFVWWQLSGYWAGDTVVIDAAAATVGRGPQRPAGALRPQARSGPAARPAARAVVARPPASRPVDGVRAMQPNVWLIRSGQATVQVRKRGRNLGFILRYPGRDLASPAVRGVIAARAQLLRDRELAAALAVTDEQLQKLRAISASLDLPLSGADQEKLASLWAEYEAASAPVAGPSQPEAESKLVTAVGEIASQQWGPGRQSVYVAAEQIREILSVEQWAQYRQQVQARAAQRTAGARTDGTGPVVLEATTRAPASTGPASAPTAGADALPSAGPASGPASLP